MAITTGTAVVGGLLPDDYSDLVWALANEESVALQATNLINTESTTVHIPVVDSTPDAAWVAELGTIPNADSTYDEVIVQPQKVAVLSTHSREVLRDSAPSIAGIIPRSMAHSLAKSLDAALFANPAPSGAPAGLNSVTPSSVVTSGYANLDAFLEAQSVAAQAGGRLTAFITDPTTALAVRSLKTGTGSNAYLLDVSAQGIAIAGVPLLVSPAVEPGVTWGLPSAHVHTVASALNELDVDEYGLFDQYAVRFRAVSRVAYAFTNESAVVKITDSGS